ncbi:BRCT domain-containing protein [Desulforamulus ferrireducens]|uniref:NAD-dependent DNA ligase n=1 Tax=Desulforamulus ferrireducens TaxID=1833852 RepID=A0A1S6IXA2_9FIRM|nr:BRCT domain-containing protein [Desulforamulus ferrireducens]AQS59406.1 NAD-dependent DNA ligase [Desulforamulus ferrireducens]
MSQLLANYELLPFRKYTQKFEIDKAMNTLEGILKGISIDNRINSKEALELKNWCEYHEGNITRHPFNEIIPLINKALEDNVLEQEEIDNILWFCRNFMSEKYFNIIRSDIQILHGIMHGILSDDVITEKELVGLQDWLDNNTHLSQSYPYDELCSLVTQVLKDGIIDDEEVKQIKVFFSQFINLDSSINIDREEIDQLKKEYLVQGICSITPEIIITNKVFCFTGMSSRASRKAIADTIQSLGGIYKDSVVKSTNYLIVGDNGNPCWCFSCYGRKVEKAMELRKKGHPIVIVHENDFWDALEELK